MGHVNQGAKELTIREKKKLKSTADKTSSESR